MKSKMMASTRYKVTLAIVSVLLVLSSCLFIAGSWFTNSQDIRGNLVEPSWTIQLDSEDIVEEDDENNIFEMEVLSYTLSSASDITDLENKSLAVNISTNLVTVNSVMRVWVEFDWGVIENNTFIPDLSEDSEVADPLPNALVPNFTNVWTGSLMTSNSEDYDYNATQPTYHYYNYYVNDNDTVIIYNGLGFISGTNESLYIGKTVVINVYVEVIPMNSQTFTDWRVSGTDTNYIYGDYAPQTWVPTTKPQA